MEKLIRHWPILKLPNHGNFLLVHEYHMVLIVGYLGLWSFLQFAKACNIQHMAKVEYLALQGSAVKGAYIWLVNFSRLFFPMSRQKCFQIFKSASNAQIVQVTLQQAEIMDDTGLESCLIPPNKYWSLYAVMQHYISCNEFNSQLSNSKENSP